MDDATLVRAFEAGDEPPEGFHHVQHVRVAWWYLCRYPMSEALGRFSEGLRRFAAARGKPERYHETITTAYVLIIEQRLSECGRDVSWEDFSRGNPDVLSWNPSVLDQYYRPETLWSEQARHTFVPPDRLSL